MRMMTTMTLLLSVQIWCNLLHRPAVGIRRPLLWTSLPNARIARDSWLGAIFLGDGDPPDAKGGSTSCSANEVVCPTADNSNTQVIIIIVTMQWSGYNAINQINCNNLDMILKMIPLRVILPFYDDNLARSLWALQQWCLAAIWRGQTKERREVLRAAPLMKWYLLIFDFMLALIYVFKGGLLGPTNRGWWNPHVPRRIQWVLKFKTTMTRFVFTQRPPLTMWMCRN